MTTTQAAPVTWSAPTIRSGISPSNWNPELPGSADMRCSVLSIPRSAAAHVTIRRSAGTGTFSVSGALCSLPTHPASADSSCPAGQLTGVGNFTVTGTRLRLALAALNPAPTLTALQGATTISGTGLRLDGGRIFRNEGTVTQSGMLDSNSRRTGVAEAGNGTVLNTAGATWNASGQLHLRQQPGCRRHRRWGHLHQSRYLQQAGRRYDHRAHRLHQHRHPDVQRGTLPSAPPARSPTAAF